MKVNKLDKLPISLGIDPVKLLLTMKKRKLILVCCAIYPMRFFSTAMYQNLPI